MSKKAWAQSIVAPALLIWMMLPGSAEAAEQANVAAPESPPAIQVPESERDRLQRLFRESSEANARRNPVAAIIRGEYRYADRLSETLSDGYVAEEKAAAEQELKALASIDRNRLGTADRIAYDTFRYRREQALRDLQPDLLALTLVRPLNHFTGHHITYPLLASGRGGFPFRNVKDYENNLSRHRHFVRLIDRVIARFRQGLGSGVVDTRLTIRNVIAQLDTQLAAAPEDSVYYGPVKDFPDSVPEEERTRLRQAHLEAIRDGIYPAYRRLRTFLQDEYLPHARAGDGLKHMRGGALAYRRLVERNTTLPLRPSQIHRLGLREVARIRGEMEALRKRVGFAGSLAQFLTHLRTDARYAPPSRTWLRDGYYAIGRRVDQRIGELFSKPPRSALEIREIEAFRERTASGGSYQVGTPDGKRPGVFYYNAYDLQSRRSYEMEAIYLHEAAPGHHFQLSLANENEALPDFMRFGGDTAFLEGWGLYAETLWDELGMETDPYQRFGGLNFDMYRALRLVVDTGIHSMGWTREQAIRYMLDNSGLGETDATADVERYIAHPGQALAYKIGQLKILELRSRAEKALGSRFDVREFHDQVLNTGAIPLPVLERKIGEWIAEKLRSQAPMKTAAGPASAAGGR